MKNKNPIVIDNVSWKVTDHPRKARYTNGRKIIPCHMLFFSDHFTVYFPLEKYGQLDPYEVTFVNHRFTVPKFLNYLYRFYNDYLATHELKALAKAKGVVSVVAQDCLEKQKVIQRFRFMGENIWFSHIERISLHEYRVVFSKNKKT